MYVQPGRCAHCGRALDDTYMYAPYNQVLKPYLSRADEQPFFCSEKHLQAEIRTYVTSEHLDKVEIDMLASRIERKYNNDFSKLSLATAEYQYELAERRKKQRANHERDLAAAYSTIVHDYNMPRMARESAEALKRTEFEYEILEPYLSNNINKDAILAAADRKYLPETFGFTFMTAFANQLNTVRSDEDYYSPNANRDIGEFLRVLLAQVPEAADDFESNIHSTGMLAVSRDPMTLVKCAYTAFKKAVGISKFQKNLYAYLGLAKDAPISDADLWALVDRRGLSPHEWIHIIFTGSHGLAIVGLLDRWPYEMRLPYSKRYEHTHILGASGAGKTTLLEDRFLMDLYAKDSPAYVVIDPKGLMIQRLSKLEAFDPETGKHKDRLIIIDPTRDPMPALGLFTPPAALGATEREKNRLMNQLLDTFAYIFSSTDARLTQRQSIPFSYVVRLVFSMGGNIDTLMDVLEDTGKGARFQNMIGALSATNDGARRFFANDFYSAEFSATRQQVKARVHEIMQSPELMEIFNAPTCKLDLFECLQNRKIVLINTAMDHLGKKASQLLGRYFISMTMMAAMARSSVQPHQRTPAFLMVDEFQEFVDEDKTPEMLRLIREYNVGAIIAHHTMHAREMNEALRTAISTNTSIKYSAAPEGIDLNYMARDLHSSTDYLSSVQKTNEHAKFACYIRGFGLSRAFTTQIPWQRAAKSKQMTAEAHARLLRQNGERLSAAPRVRSAPLRPSAPPPPPPPPKPATHTPDADVLPTSWGGDTINKS